MNRSGTAQMFGQIFFGNGDESYERERERERAKTVPTWAVSGIFFKVFSLLLIGLSLA
jgi:hypothetical protein